MLISIVDLLSYFSVLPSKVVAFEALSSWLATNGLLLVGVLSFLENIAVANAYFPGSVAILAAMHGASSDYALILEVWLIVTVGGIAGQIVTFKFGGALLSRFSSRDAVGSNKAKVRPLALALSSFWHPHLASIACLRLAEIKMPTINFIGVSIVASSAWNTFWTVFVINFGNIFAEGIVGSALVYGYLLVWIALAERKHFMNRGGS
ncbi:hypothetical protein [Thalassobius sp. Cn5-15]|uniref:hypothetical protein n=1 Tax=Thalassobius sp. Cn5-15 TaxID=2917763 RepID=UPI001EF26C3E|nr:hypothetical protein [Thalassobius sp. Cn5-15]MCG7493300.1 hypothetical protein [Thalassobius sp. Cn5-15]